MVGAELTKWHGQAPRLRPDKIKSLCEGYHIDNELDHARLSTYTSQRRLICVRKGEGQRWQEINSLVSIPSLESTVDRVPSFFLDRLDCLLQTETEGQVEEGE
jgi:hypothetical protein